MHQQAPHQEAVRRHQHLFKHHLPDIPTSSAMSSYVNRDLAMRGCTCGCEGSGIGLDSVARLVGPWQAAVQIEMQNGGRTGGVFEERPAPHTLHSLPSTVTPLLARCGRKPLPQGQGWSCRLHQQTGSCSACSILKDSRHVKLAKFYQRQYVRAKGSKGKKKS